MAFRQLNCMVVCMQFVNLSGMIRERMRVGCAIIFDWFIQTLALSCAYYRFKDLVCLLRIPKNKHIQLF